MSLAAQDTKQRIEPVRIPGFPRGRRVRPPPPIALLAGGRDWYDEAVKQKHFTRERVQAAMVIDRESPPKLGSHALIVEGERMDDKASGHAASPCTAGTDYRSHANRVTTIRGASASERRPHDLNSP
jgi:hypothetical protein